MRTLRKVASSGRGMRKIDSRPTAREHGRSVAQGRQIISRDRELAMLVALGARRGRLVRQCLTERTIIQIAKICFVIMGF